MRKNRNLTWTIEDRLLLSCCRNDGEERIKDRILEAKNTGIDWDKFLSKARDNRVKSFVYHNLREKEIVSQMIPSGVVEDLQTTFYLDAANNTLLFKELGEILKSLKKCRLEVIVLKGAALATFVYENLALRTMSDVDILVKAEDLLHVDEQLQKLGYSPLDLSAEDVDFSSAYLTTLDYYNPSRKSFPIHVHWHFVNSTVPNDSYTRCIVLEHIWDEAEKVVIGGEETLVMSPHHFLIHLSEHALRVRHSLGKWIYFCDIDAVIHHYEGRVDWSRLIHESCEFNLDKMVYISLFFTREFFNTKIPEDVLLKLRPKKIGFGIKIFMSSVRNNTRLSGLSYLVHLSMNRGIINKVRFLWRTLFPPRKILAQRNYVSPSGSISIYYLKRIKEVFSRISNILKIRRSVFPEDK
ncbi:MAG: nucleotidyltransferase family protein [Candidatus Aminicenantes bacterium]|nr:nucleotidyltransferase family protein [Candidatus Aminicenantes bacterium]